MSEPKIINIDPNNSKVSSDTVFSSCVYRAQYPEFLENALNSTNDALDWVKKEKPTFDEMYPVYQTPSLLRDPRMAQLMDFIGTISWDILDSQGYDMSNFRTTFYEMWGQEHFKYSGMEEHIHSYGAQLIGFYFLETPEKCSNIIIHDPRPGKKQIDLRQKDEKEITFSTSAMQYSPTPGLLFLANSWLPHSFSKNASDLPMKFIHFTVGIQYIPPTTETTSTVEVI